MKFPKPWRLQQTGRHEFVVVDAKDRKLFYIVGDEGDPSENDEDYIPPSVLFYGADEDSDLLVEEIADMLERLDK
jgi:hypothetical protein